MPVQRACQRGLGCGIPVAGMPHPREKPYVTGPIARFLSDGVPCPNPFHSLSIAPCLGSPRVLCSLRDREAGLRASIPWQARRSWRHRPPGHSFLISSPLSRVPPHGTLSSWWWWSYQSSGDSVDRTSATTGEFRWVCPTACGAGSLGRNGFRSLVPPASASVRLIPRGRTTLGGRSPMRRHSVSPRIVGSPDPQAYLPVTCPGSLATRGFSPPGSRGTLRA